MSEAKFAFSGSLQKLTSDTKEGDFVLRGQELAETEGFSHVSKIWYDQTYSYADGRQMIHSDRQNTEDLPVILSDLKPVVDDDGYFGIQWEPTGRIYRPTGHALTQLGIKTEFATGFAKKLAGLDDEASDVGDAETLVAIVKNSFRKVDPEKVLLLRTRTNGVLRAVLSTQYACINNDWFLGILEKYVPGGRLSHWRGDSDTMFGNILVPDTIRKEDDSDYGGMVSLSNCEIGTRRFGLQPSIFRAICMNGCIWGQTEGKKLNQVHKGEIDLKALEMQVRDSLHFQLDLLTTGIDMLLETRSKSIPDGMSVEPIFAELAKEAKLSRQEARKVLDKFTDLKGGNAQRTLFGVVNSLTLAGQDFENSRWVAADEFAGQVVQSDTKDWNRFVNAAATIKAKEVTALLAL